MCDPPKSDHRFCLAADSAKKYIERLKAKVGVTAVVKKVEPEGPAPPEENGEENGEVLSPTLEDACCPRHNAFVHLSVRPYTYGCFCPFIHARARASDVRTRMNLRTAHARTCSHVIAHV